MFEAAMMVLASVFAWSTLVVLMGLAAQLFRRGGERAEAAAANAEPRFAVVICAHNEERVIERPLKSILAADYPADKIDIYVFADNCSDMTAAVAAAVEGVKVCEKNTPSAGKGDVLAWGLDAIDRSAYDAIAVFDADNEVDRGWFSQIGRCMAGGANIVTGHRMSSNAFVNLITGWYTIYWNLMNELSNRVRSNLGLSAMLTGTGFAFRTSVLPAEGWRTNTFVEDLEFALMRNLEGHRIFYAPDAVFFDEQPVSVRPMVRQLNRWATGGLQVLWRYWWRWLKTLVRHPSFRLLDALVVISLGVTGTMMIVVNAVMLNWRFAVCLSAAAWLSAVLSTAFSRYSLRSLALPILLFPVFTLVLSYTVAYSIVFPQRKWRPIAHGN
jgi:cellulose synthase/poly-beta-1,6-N-acetylglucosamine synthase-like glycosyltransferase